VGDARRAKLLVGFLRVLQNEDVKPRFDWRDPVTDAQGRLFEALWTIRLSHTIMVPKREMHLGVMTTILSRRGVCKSAIEGS
jgi:hypothetical protein